LTAINVTNRVAGTSWLKLHAGMFELFWRGDSIVHKQILFHSAAREKILRGATQLADAIRITLGPRSKSVLIENKRGSPIICNDGGSGVLRS
jgi:hypothetical protein